MSIPRRLEPELLDRLRADDPLAVGARRDLKRVNAWMRNARCVASLLQARAGTRQPHTVLDLGSGDGALILEVARHLAPHWRDVKVILLDQQNIVSDATREGFAALQWHAEAVSADVFDYLARAPSDSIDAITANLFLHHLSDQQLARLFEKAAELAWLVVACEPRRAKFVVEISRKLGVLGCNEVTVHDAVASARAGFAGHELSSLWPRQGQWELQERTAFVFNHMFAARQTVARG
jgi:Methyltransferase domain